MSVFGKNMDERKAEIKEIVAAAVTEVLKEREISDRSRDRANALRSGAFDSRRSAFDYFITYEGMDIEQAGIESDKIVKYRGVPDMPIPPKTLIQKTESVVEAINVFSEKYPKIADFAVGAGTALISGGAGFLIGKKSEEKEEKGDPLNVDIDAEPKRLTRK